MEFRSSNGGITESLTALTVTSAAAALSYDDEDDARQRAMSEVPRRFCV
jgi:hypothetical protein